MSFRRNLSRVIGGVQCVLGIVASLFAYVIYVSAHMREQLGITQEEVALFMLVLVVFSVLSALSGVVLLRERC